MLKLTYFNRELIINTSLATFLELSLVVSNPLILPPILFLTPRRLLLTTSSSSKGEFQYFLVGHCAWILTNGRKIVEGEQWAKTNNKPKEWRSKSFERANKRTEIKWECTLKDRGITKRENSFNVNRILLKSKRKLLKKIRWRVNGVKTLRILINFRGPGK